MAVRFVRNTSWLLLFIAWIIGMLFIILHLELFMGMNGVITRATTRYNIQHKRNIVQSAIAHFNEHESVLADRIKNVSGGILADAR